MAGKSTDIKMWTVLSEYKSMNQKENRKKRRKRATKKTVYSYKYILKNLIFAKWTLEERDIVILVAGDRSQLSENMAGNRGELADLLA